MYVQESRTSVTSLIGWQSSRAAARGSRLRPKVLDGATMWVNLCLHKQLAFKLSIVELYCSTEADRPR